MFISVEFPDDTDDGKIESVKSVAMAPRWTAIKYPSGITRAQAESFMAQSRKVLEVMALKGMTIEEMGQEAVNEGAPAVQQARPRPRVLPPHRCDATCHHQQKIVHQTTQEINA